MDQCMNCTVRGDIDACMKTPCSQHESWYAQTLKALAKQEQGEPIGYFYFDENQWRQASDPISFPGCTKFYTTPQQLKPLTHEQRLDLLIKFKKHELQWDAPSALIDMVEAAHGIKE